MNQTHYDHLHTDTYTIPDKICWYDNCKQTIYKRNGTMVRVAVKLHATLVNWIVRRLNINVFGNIEAVCGGWTYNSIKVVR